MAGVYIMALRSGCHKFAECVRFVKWQIWGYSAIVILHQTNKANQCHRCTVDSDVSQVCGANYAHFKICVTGD